MLNLQIHQFFDADFFTNLTKYPKSLRMTTTAYNVALWWHARGLDRPLSKV